MRNRQPFRLRDALDFSPVAGRHWIRSKGSPPADGGVRQSRRTHDRTQLGAVHRDGQQLFSLSSAGIDPQRGAMLGMSLLMGARGIGAVMGPLFSARWAGHSDRRLRLGILLGYLIIGVGYLGLGLSPNVWVACACDRSGPLRRIHRLGFFHHHLATQYRRPFPRPRVLSRSRLLDADHRYRRLCLWTLSRPWSVGCERWPRQPGLIMIVPALLWAWGMRSGRAA